MTSGQARLVGPALLLLLAVGCGGDPSGPASGSLALSVTGLPGGVAADVTVTGPGHYRTSLTGSGTLAGLTPGGYVVTAAAVSAGPLSYAPSPLEQTAIVSAGDTPASVGIGYGPASGRLTVSVTGLPAGTAPAITVTGPGGYDRSLDGAGTLTGLPGGSYTVTALAVSDGADQFTPSPSSQSVLVQPGSAASAAVAYATRSGGGFNLRVDGLYLVQSVQTYDRTVPLVRDRDALLRVFVTANQVNAAAPAVRARIFSGGSLVSTLTIAAPGPVTPQSPDEGALTSSWNLVVPGTLVQPGMTMLVDVDPDNAIPEGNEADNGFPAGGVPLAVDVRTAAPFSVRFVPVKTSADGRQGNVTDANKAQFLPLAMRMHPLATYDADVRAVYTTTMTSALESDNANGAWTTLVGELNALRTADGSSRYYYGVVNPVYGGGVAGVGYIGWPTAVGWDRLPGAAYVAAHEWGHNWGRQHAPCGGAPNPDASFPSSDGSIGHYGYDQATELLKPPTSHDIMGYCSDEWISDYTYTRVLDFRAANSAAAGVLGSAVQPALLVWGRIENGRAVLEPAFQIVTRPSLPASPGPYRVEGRRADGSAEFSLRFAPLEVGDLPGSARHFAFAVPLRPERMRGLVSLHLEGEGISASAARLPAAPAAVTASRTASGRLSLRWDASRAPMVMVRDPLTGEILSFARGGRAEIATARGDLSLIVSDRVGSRDLRLTVPPR